LGYRLTENGYILSCPGPDDDRDDIEIKAAAVEKK